MTPLAPATREAFLAATAVIDWQHPAIGRQAAALGLGCADDRARVQRSFEFVRDAIAHSIDAQRGPVTCSASAVLEHATGLCYAKSHLLAALLRAQGIPTGFCYQRLSVGDGGAPFCLHGLNAVYLDALGWYRLDARGNKPGVDAQFTPPVERLAFVPQGEGERDYADILSAPLPPVIAALTRHTTLAALIDDLPDLGDRATLAR